jgi:hypothetical protein
MVWFRRSGSKQALGQQYAPGAGKGTGKTEAKGGGAQPVTAMAQYQPDATQLHGKGKPKGAAGAAAMAMSADSLLILAGRNARMKRQPTMSKPKQRPRGGPGSRSKQSTAENFPESMNRLISMGRAELREARGLTTQITN